MVGGKNGVRVACDCANIARNRCRISFELEPRGIESLSHENTSAHKSRRPEAYAAAADEFSNGFSTLPSTEPTITQLSSKFLPGTLAKYRKCRPSGKNRGWRWELSPRSTFSLVIGTESPPSAETR